jgi:hypothetical protein
LSELQPANAFIPIEPQPASTVTVSSPVQPLKARGRRSHSRMGC